MQKTFTCQAVRSLKQIETYRPLGIIKHNGVYGVTTNPQHLALLRQTLLQQNLTGFIVPLTDEHMSEYVGQYAQRLGWLTGFEGSAGWAVVLRERAAIFVDGRYVVQVVTDVDDAYFERIAIADISIQQWLAEAMGDKERIGYDPELATMDWVTTMRTAISGLGGTLVAVEENPIDSVWQDQPEAPMSPLSPHPLNYAGESSEDKRSKIAATLKKQGADAAVITMLDSVAWLYNIRAKDVFCTPVPHAFALVHSDGHGTLFVHPDKMTDATRVHLGNGVEVKSRDDFYPTLSALAATGATVMVDKETNNARVIETLSKAGATLTYGDDPCALAKAKKNPVEQQGARTAHVRDGAAICNFLKWLDDEAPKGTLDELSVAEKLWSFRQEQNIIEDISFNTISAAGPNAAMCHYKVTEKSNRALRMNEIYLVDSGGQYRDGTTDITRTIIVGTPSDEHKDRFTRVLKGHIALSRTRFPKGTTGQALDAIARAPLWAIGRDYDHGTGHGVGSFLAVHEGPQRIAKFGKSGVALEAGMILSNEPGYYKAGAYGIRIENLVLVVPTEDDPEGRGFMMFENLTWAPIDRRLIEVSLLDQEELSWLNKYHQMVYDKISPLVNAAVKSWLLSATAPLRA